MFLSISLGSWMDKKSGVVGERSFVMKPKSLGQGTAKGEVAFVQ